MSYLSEGNYVHAASTNVSLEGPTQTSDAAAVPVRIIAGSAWNQATVNTGGANLDLAPGTGRRLFTAVSNTAGVVVLTLTVDGTAVTLTSGTDFDLGSDNTAPQLAVTATNLAAAINADGTLSAAISAAASTSSVYVTKLVGTRTVTIATDQAGRISTTSGADGVVAPWGQIAIPDGLGAITQLKFPTDQGALVEYTSSLRIGGGSGQFAVSGTGAGIKTALGLQWSPDANPANIGAASTLALSNPSSGILKVGVGNYTGYGSIRAEWPRRTFGVAKTPGTGATLTAWGGAPTHTLTGTASNVSDSTGHYVQLSGDAAIGGIDIATTECCKTEIAPIFTAVIKTGALLPVEAGERIWVGVASASLAAADSASGIHVAAFRYAIDSDGTAFWRFVTNDGGGDVGTVTTTTSAIAAATRYVLTIDATNSASITAYVNGALVATHATNVPTATQALGTSCFGLDAGAGTMEMLISEIRYETN